MGPVVVRSTSFGDFRQNRFSARRWGFAEAFDRTSQNLILALLFICLVLGASGCDQQQATESEDSAFIQDYESEVLTIDSTWETMDEATVLSLDSIDENSADVFADVLADTLPDAYAQTDEAETYSEPIILIETPPSASPEPIAGPSLSAADWQDVTRRGPYEVEVPPKPKEPDVPPVDEAAAAKFVEQLVSILSWVGIAVGLCLLIWLGYKYYENQVDTSVSGRAYVGTDSLMNASETELATQLEENLGERNFHLAIRYRFGQLLQALRKKRLLEWVPGSTNAEYAAALPTSLQADFRRLAEVFDFAAYGGREVTAEQYADFADRVLDYAKLVGLPELQTAPSRVASFGESALPQNLPA